LYLFNIFRKTSGVYIYHIVWYCDTCFSVVYGDRIQNSSIIQLYEISNDKIIFKSKFIEETRKGFLLTRFLKPYFSSYGTYGYIIRFDQLNIGKSKQKAFPHVVRIHFNQSVCLIYVERENNKSSIIYFFISIHKSMRHHRKISMQMKSFMLIILVKFILLDRV